MKTKNFFGFLLPIVLFISFVPIDKNASARVSKSNISMANWVLSENPCEKDSILSFLNRFCMDSNFQYDRIVFPIVHIEKLDAYDEDDIVSNIRKEEWKYVNFRNLPNDYIVNIDESSDISFKLNIQIEDTGVSVFYVFELVDCIWYLTNIINESI